MSTQACLSHLGQPALPHCAEGIKTHLVFSTLVSRLTVPDFPVTPSWVLSFPTLFIVLKRGKDFKEIKMLTEFITLSITSKIGKAYVN